MTDRKSLLHVPVYPFLIALAPVISLYAVNRLELGPYDVVRPAAVCIFLALLAVAVSRAVSRSSRSAALLGCFLLISMFAYGYVFRSVSSAFEIENLNRYFLPVWSILTLGAWALLALTLRRQHSPLRNITKIFNVVSIVLIAAASVPLMFGSSASQSAVENSSIEEQSNDPVIAEWLSSVGDINQDNNEFPDIYYLILDGYARGDVLRSRFDFDNSDFLDWLEAKGFFVGHLSHSNYPWTALSLSATFNLEYLQTLLPEDLGSSAPEGGRGRFQFFSSVLSKDYIKNSRIHHFFSSLGYRIVSNVSGYAVTRIESASFADAMLSPINEFEETLISNSILEPLVWTFKDTKSTKRLRLNKYDQVVNTLEEFGDVANAKGPKFVFYHIASPHHHYCFDENGGVVPRHPVYEASPWGADRRAIPGYFAWGRKNYPRNVAGLNIHVKETIKRVLDDSEGDAIVIIQSDHGSAYGLDPSSVANTDVVERLGILNAIYVPDRFPQADLHNEISSVNTFRMILRNVFDVNLPVLENRAFFSMGDLEFEEVTDRL